MLDLNELEVFRAVVSERSISAAGRRLNLSQPSISRIVKSLERRLGFRLFVRRSRGVTPTAEAKIFLTQLERSYAALSSLEDYAREIAQMTRGELSLITNQAISLEVAPNALAHLNLKDNDISVTCQCKSSDWIIDAARSGIIKTAIANGETLPPDMHREMLSKTPHMCILPKESAIAARDEPLTLEHLRGLRLVSLTGEVRSFLAGSDMGSEQGPLVTCENSIGSIALAKKLGFVPIVDAFTAHYWEGLTNDVARPILELPTYSLALFTPSGAHLSMLDKKLQTHLRDEVEQIEAWAFRKTARPVRAEERV